MTELIDAAVVWPTLLVALAIFGAAPNLALRLLLRAYPKDHPRRAELWAELQVVPRWERPFWVCEQVDGALFEGLKSRRRRKAVQGHDISLDFALRILRTGSSVVVLSASGRPVAELNPGDSFTYRSRTYRCVGRRGRLDIVRVDRDATRRMVFPRDK